MSSLSAQDLEKMIELFEIKKWDRTTKEPPCFDDFCQSLECLSENEKKLFFFLSNKFLLIRGIDYYALAKSILGKMTINRPIKKIIILPLKQEKDQHKIKSSDCFLYFLTNELKLRYPDVVSYAHYKFIPNSTDFTRTLLIFPDDFIGSGEYMIGLYDELLKYFSRTKIPNVLCFSILCCQDAFNNLTNRGIRVIHHYDLHKKGIADDQQLSKEDKDMLYNILSTLSRKLRIHEKYIKGYNEIEAVTCLERTPNNTFGFYWQNDLDIEGKKWKNLFPRLQQKNKSC